MVKLALAIALVAGCFEDRYECKADRECNLGGDGHCELDGRCTYADTGCLSGRRYTPHSGAVSEACFVDNRDPLNPCADGQPPAAGEDACIADVCAAVPECCESAWTSVCVQEMQLRCDQRCDTVIAITARRGTDTELFTLAYAEDTWTATGLPAGAFATYLAPAPGRVQPRLARVVNEPGVSSLYIDDDPAIGLPARTYYDVASADWDRDGRDKIALSSAVDATLATSTFEVRDLANPDVLTLEVASAMFLGISAWADYDHDSFVDAVYGFDRTYRVIKNNPHAVPRETFSQVLPALAGTPPPAMRAFEWARFTPDGLPDLIASGTRAQMHVSIYDVSNAIVPVNNSVDDFADCATPERLANCPNRNPEESYVATVRPTRDAGTLIMAATGTRRLWNVTFDAAHAAHPTPLAIAPCTQLPCAPIIALATRQLDDGALDIIAIDKSLQLWTTSSASEALVPSIRLPSSFAQADEIRLSISGRPRGNLNP